MIMIRNIRLGTLLLFTLGSATAVGSCGDLVAGGLTGEASVLLSGDAVTSIGNLSVLASPSPPAPAEGVEDPEGEVEAEFQLFLVAEDGTLVALTDGDVRVRVDLQGVREPEVARQVVTAGAYTALRIVFTEIEAEIDAGVVINGVPVLGSVEIEIEGMVLTVDRPLNLTIGDDEVAVLIVDLNAASWLEAVDPVSATVDAQLFANLITVVVQ
jgi:hypothetical protein